MSELANSRCEACNELTVRLSFEGIQRLVKEISGWSVDWTGDIQKFFHFNDFAEALAFVVKIGGVAEAENHYPDISFGWQYVRVKLTTHAIGGLSKNDFILAAKIDALT